MNRGDDFQRLVHTLITDEQAHVMHQVLWGGVDSGGHRAADGEPLGDCYKCRIIRDELHDALRKYERGVL